MVTDSIGTFQVGRGSTAGIVGRRTPNGRALIESARRMHFYSLLVIILANNAAKAVRS